MFIVFSMAIPVVLGQLLSPKRPLLQASPWAAMLVFVAVAAQLVAGITQQGGRVLVPMAFTFGLIAFTSVMWTSSRRAMPTLLGFFGAAMNLVPIAVHGAMPVVAQSRELVASNPLVEPAALGAKHREMEWSEINPMTLIYSDWIPVPIPGAPAIVSIGDVLLVLAFVVLGLLQRSRIDNQCKVSRRQTHQIARPTAHL